MSTFQDRYESLSNEVEHQSHFEYHVVSVQQCLKEVQLKESHEQNSYTIPMIRICFVFIVPPR